MPHCEFKYNLSDKEIVEARELYDAADHAAIEQYPGWRSVAEDGEETCFCVARENGKVTSFAQIAESRGIFRRAHIQFGPLFGTADAAIETISKIHEHYRSRGFLSLSIQMAIPTGATADYIEYRLSRTLRMSQRFDSASCWSSLVVDLSRDAEEIFGTFSKGHRSAIKKAEREGIVVEKGNGREDAIAFSGVFAKMSMRRGLSAPDACLNRIPRIIDFLEETGKGILLKVTDRERRMVGGIIVVFQGATARYYKGAADPDADLPVLHTAIWEAIKKSKGLGCRVFDLWGYNFFVDKSDQRFNINIFKKGFSGDYIFYPKAINFIFKPVQCGVLGSLRVLKRAVGGVA